MDLIDILVLLLIAALAWLWLDSLTLRADLGFDHAISDNPTLGSRNYQFPFEIYMLNLDYLF